MLKSRFGILPAFDKRDVIHTAFCGGYPEPMSYGERSRRRWYAEYMQDLLTKDVQDVTEVRKLSALQKVAEWMMAYSSKFFEMNGLCQAAQLDKETVANYLSALKAMYVPMMLLGLEGFVFDVVLGPFDALAVVIDRSRNGFEEEWRWVPEVSGDGTRSAVLEITHYKVGGRAPVQIRLEGVRKGIVRVSDQQGRWYPEWTLTGDATMELISKQGEFEGGGSTRLQVPYDEKAVHNVQGCHWHANAWPYFYSEAIRFDFSSDFEGVLMVDDVKVYDTDLTDEKRGGD